MGTPIFRATTIAEAFQGTQNRFTLIRLILAGAVLLEHAAIVTQGPGYPPPLALHGWSLSYAAVNGFFIVSGFLIAGSLERRKDAVSFAVARALRIMPALVVLSLAAVLVIGPLVTTVSAGEYWSSPATWRFPLHVLGFLDTSQGPAGVFADNPWSGEFSAPLWTLRYEVLAYIGAGVLVLSPLPWTRRTALILYLATTLGHALLSGAGQDLSGLLTASARLSAPFALGMLIHALRHSWPVSPWPAAAAVGVWWLAGASPLAEPFLNLALAAGLFWIAFAPLGGLPTWHRMPDWSYGVYIWHYPVMQAVLVAKPGAGPVETGLAALVVTMPVAAASWHFVERPSLSLKAPVARLFHATRSA